MTNSRVALGVIPARAHSSRFPFKMLAKIAGKPMLQYVWEAALRARTLSEVLIATDHSEIAQCVEEFGGKVVMTPELNSGSDRVAFVAKEFKEEIVVNIQGDEPLLEGSTIDCLVEALLKYPEADLSTLAIKKAGGEELTNPNCVKVVVNREGEALYFSRSPLCSKPNGEFLKHLGIYAYRRNALLNFCSLSPSALEMTEKLEQLRALENGMRIQVVLTEHETIAVDIPEDIAKVEARLLRR